MEDNKCGKDSRMVLLDDEHSGETIIYENTNTIKNRFPQSIDSVLSSLQIWGTK